jgi:hypothetical protein
MRNAINNNPIVQIAVVGILVVFVGLFLMMNMKKGSSSTSSSSSSTTAATSSTAGSSAGTTGAPLPVPTGGAPAASAGAGATAGPSVAVAPPTPSALVPGPGLPAPVIDSWKRGDAVVLLIVQKGGIDDRLVRQSVESLRARGGVAVFVAPATQVARYARITQGVGVDRTPALIVVRPRADSGPVPQAQVSYGFRNAQSVVQAVYDELYTGPDNLPYYPR